MKLWDPDDVSRLAVVNTDCKETAKIYQMVKQKSEEDTDDSEVGPCMSDLGMDNHSAMSLMAGVLKPSSAGAWQYLADRTDWTNGSSCPEAQVAIHCRCSTRKASVDPNSRLEIVCRADMLIKRQATHVVVAISYGLEAFCLFSQQDPSTGDEEATQKLLSFANFFANGLLDGRNGLEVDQDDEGDEEDGGQHLIPSNVQCQLYSDLIAAKSGQRWTSKSVAEQYEACREVFGHQANKAVPLRVWLYPLRKLMLAETGINKMPGIQLDISRNLVIRCQKMWDWLRLVRLETDKLVNDMGSQEECSVGGHWVPTSLRQRVRDFDGLLKKYVMALSKSLLEWTVSVRQSAGLIEETMGEMVRAIETKSPFVPKELSCWIHHQTQQIKTLNMLAKLPGLELVMGLDRLKREIRSGGDGTFAVVLHLPSLAEQSDGLVSDMSRFVDIFATSQPASWINWNIKAASMMGRIPAARRRFFTAGQEFSDWITNHNSDANVRYLVFYDERPIKAAGQILPTFNLFDCGSDAKSVFKIPKAPGQVVVEKNRRGVITLSWTTEETTHFSSFLVQYQRVDRPGDSWDTVQHPTNTLTINYLQSDESYVFRVAAVTLGGRSPFSLVSEEISIDPVCPSPTGLKCLCGTESSMTIAWNHQQMEEDGSDEDKTLNSFAVECWTDGHQESTFIQRSTTGKIITLEPLVPDTVYCVQIRAVCSDAKGSSFYSLACPVLKVKTMREPERPALIVRRASQKCSAAASGIDTYNVPLKKHRGTATPGVGHYVFGEPSYAALAGKRRQRTILMLGATGSGKSTLINALVNYVLGVEWEDDFRFKLIDESTDKSQAHSQTDLVTTYDLYEMKGSRLGYSLTVVDTPGFGDTRGLEKDKEIMDQLQSYFKSHHGIQQLEAVCFVVQSSLPRLTATQKHIFDSILSIFGQDIGNNIRLMVTFADNALPPVLEAVKEAGIPSPTDPLTGLPLHHKFNNSIFFTSNKGDRDSNEFNRTYFDMAVTGFDRFFDDLSRMEATSLTLTREVLEERKRLEALVEGLQMRTEIKLTRVDEFQQIKKILMENREQMEANKNFEFEVEFLVPKATDISRSGQFTTNCQKCKTTCHFPCRQAADESKHLCSVMDPNGRCRICSCPWNEHFNQKYRYEMVKEKVKRSSDAIRQQYQGAANEALTNEELLDNIQREIDDYEKQLMELMQATYPCIRRLNEIALKPHPFSAPDYIDLMIATEKQEHRPGYQQRIATLQKLRKMSEITAQLVQDQKSSQKPVPRSGPSALNRRVSSIFRSNNGPSS